MILLYRVFTILLGCLLLSSCALFPAKIEPSKSYVIDRLPPTPIKGGRRALTLLVMPMDTNAIFNTTQMAYTTKPHQIAYFTKNQWADLPTNMLQKLLVQGLHNTQSYRAIVAPPFPWHYDYLVNTQLIELKQNFLIRPSSVQLVMSVQLVGVSRGSISGSKEFRVTEPITQCTPYGGVLAANRAAVRLLGQVIQYIGAVTH